MSTAGLRNIGPKSAAWLRQVGLHQSEDLVAAGAVQAPTLPLSEYSGSNTHSISRRFSVNAD